MEVSLDKETREEFRRALEDILGKYPYEPPIEITWNKIADEFDGAVLRAVWSVGVDVDKKRLVEALEYDASAYKKGWDDAMSAVLDRLDGSKLSANDILDVFQFMPAEKAERLAGRLQTALYLYYRSNMTNAEKEAGVKE